MNRLKEYRERYGLSQPEAVAAIRRRAIARGDIVEPGLDRPALSRHENGHKRPGPYYQRLYCEVYGATPAELGFRLALPGENGNHEDVNRREFLAGAAGLAASAALPALPEPTRLGQADIERVREAATRLYELDQAHGAGSVYALSKRHFQRLRGLAARATYNEATGKQLHELLGHAAQHAGWLAYDADQHDDVPRGWWLEALHWAQVGDADQVSIRTMAALSMQASEQRRSREAIDLASAAQRTAGRGATPRLKSMLLAREALGRAGIGDAASARAALGRAREHADTRHDDDPRWLDFYGMANFAWHEQRAALTLGDLGAAEDAARAALALGDPVVYARNHALYLTRLAEVLAQRREVEESATVASQATAAAAGLDSGRLTSGLRAVARRLAPYRDEPAVGQFLAAV